MRLPLTRYIALVATLAVLGGCDATSATRNAPVAPPGPALSSGLAQAGVCRSCWLGPIEFRRDHSTPRETRLQFSASPDLHYRITVTSLGTPGLNVRVWINGLEIVRPAELTALHGEISRIVSLHELSSLTVRNLGKPGSGVSVRIEAPDELAPEGYPLVSRPVVLDASAFGAGRAPFWVESALGSPALMQPAVAAGAALQPTNASTTNLAAGTPLVDATGPQIVFVKDSDAKVVGVAIADPTTASPDTIDASAVTLALILRTPGLWTNSPQTLRARRDQVKALPCFATARQQIANQLPLGDLTTLGQNSDVGAALAACIGSAAEAILTGSVESTPSPVNSSALAPQMFRAQTPRGPAAISASPSTGAAAKDAATAGPSFFAFGASLPAGTDVVQFENRSWRYVTIYRQDVIPGSTSPSDPIPLGGDNAWLSGAQPLSLVDVFTNLVFRQSVLEYGTGSDPSFATVNSTQSIYWISGWGLASGEPAPPSVKTSAYAHVGTAWTYLIVPVANSLLPDLGLDPFSAVTAVSCVDEGLDFAGDLRDMVESSSTDRFAGLVGFVLGMLDDALTKDECLKSIFKGVVSQSAARKIEGLVKPVDYVFGAANLGMFLSSLSTVPSVLKVEVVRPVPASMDWSQTPAPSAETGAAVQVQVIVRDAGGEPVAGYPVTFSVRAGGGTVALDPASSLTTSVTATTSTAGLATAYWSLGSAPGTNTIAADANYAGVAVPNGPLSATVVATSGGGSGTGQVSFTDDFSSGLGKWVQATPSGSWTIDPDGRLVGEYDIACGSIGCTQSDLLLRDDLQPGNRDWDATVRFTSVRYPYSSAYDLTFALAMFSLWVSPTEKEALSIGYTVRNVAMPTTLTTVQVDQQHYYPWSRTETVPEQQVSPWQPGAWNTATLQKRGTKYTLLLNGAPVHTFSSQLTVPPKLGLHIYGKMVVDDFSLTVLP